MFRFEAFVESLGDAVSIEGVPQAGDDVGEGDGLFVFQWPDDGFQLLRIRRWCLGARCGYG